ncbi:DNA ligase (ATP) [Cichlidogyrus casuarinus]|uniref:DNA ligase n=1 Tax=Cichlidogyrus casuarinus TaxID=1844966 RepID=A0ABD2Q128_9PLAT
MAKFKGFLQSWDKLAEKELGEDFDFHPGLYRAALFNLLCILYPDLVKDQPSYCLKPITLTRVYLKTLGLSPHCKDALKLKYFNCNGGDFADVLHQVLAPRAVCSKKLSLLDVQQRLKTITRATKVADKVKIFTEFTRCCDALEQKWIARLITSKNTGLGLGRKTILDMAHPSASLFLASTPNLLTICASLLSLSIHSVYSEERLTSLCKSELRLFVPFAPMLCQRANSCDELVGFVQAPNVLLETKYDGERVQIHKSDTTYRYWSRSGLEWTENYAHLSQRLNEHNPFAGHVKSCVLDGEMLGYDARAKRFVNKATGFDVKHCEGKKTHPAFIAFDVLFLNGVDQSKKSTKERKLLLVEMFGLETCDEGLSTSPKCVLEDTLYLANFCIVPCLKEEGLIAKTLSSTYQQGKRNKSGWFKLKPDYVDGLMTDFDCVVVGGYLSDAKFSATPNHINCIVKAFLCAVVGNGENFLSFCRVSTGLTREELTQVNEKLRPHWTISVPSWLDLGSDVPDVFVKPEQSLVMQIHGAELVKTRSFAAGLTMRFPRIVGLREDKPWDQVTTLKELHRINTASGGKLVQACVPNSDIEDDDQLDIGPVAKGDGPEFCLLLSNKAIEEGVKHRVEQLISDKGFRISMNPQASTDYVVADTLDEKGSLIFRVRNLMQASQRRQASGKEGAFDIVKADWILRWPLAENWLPPVASDFICARASTKERLSNSTEIETFSPVDKFGDDFIQPATATSLGQTFSHMQCSSPSDKFQCGPMEPIRVPGLTEEEARQLACENNIDCMLTGPLSACFILLVGCSADGLAGELRLKLLAVAGRFMGATVVDTVQVDEPRQLKMGQYRELTHVCVDSDAISLSDCFLEQIGFERLSPDEGLGMDYFQLSRSKFLKQLKVTARVAKPEDQIDMAPLFNKQSDILRQYYGEYYIAELVEAQNDETKCFALENCEKKTVAFICVTSKFDYHRLIDTYDLSLFLPELITKTHENRPWNERHLKDDQDSPKVEADSITKRALVIELFAIEPEFESRASEILKVVFRNFPNHEILLMAKPTDCIVPALLKDFVKLHPWPKRDSNYDLYCFHRGNLEGKLTFRKSLRKDLDQIKLLIRNMLDVDQNAILSHLKDYYQFGRTKMHEKLQVCVALTKANELVGFAILSDEENIDWVRANYCLDDYIYFEHYDRRSHGRLLHFHLLPRFHNQDQMFLKEMMSLYCRKSIFFYNQMSPENTLISCFERMSILGVREPLIYSENRDLDQQLLPTEETVYGFKNCFKDPAMVKPNLFHLPWKSIFTDRLEISSKIVVIGASTTGIAFLDRLANEFVVLFLLQQDRFALLVAITSFKIWF